MEKITNIGGRLHNTAVGGAVAGANEIKDDTKGKMQNVINQETDAELVRLDETKQNNLTFDQTPAEESTNPVTSGGVYAADMALQQAIEAILLLIPSAASALNQLADKEFVNSSISTATATPRGTYNVVTDLHLAVDATHQQIEAALSEVVTTADKNDYCYVQVPVSSESPDIQRTERYKFNSDAWIYEYDLNTSGYTAAQWAAINSGITAALVGDLNAIKTYIPSEATALNQLADKAYVLAQIIANTPAFKGQFTTLSELQAVQSPKAGDIGIVRTKDSDGHDVFTFYQYKNEQWNEFYTLSYHPQLKPASTGVNGNYPFNGMGRCELPMNMVDGWLNDTWVYYPKNGVVYLLYSWNLQLYAVYNSLAQEGLGLDNNLVVKPANYNIADISDIVGNRYLSFTEDGGVYTITKPDDDTITSTELNNTTILNYNDPNHHGVNVLMQSMFPTANTIYVIQHDYVLGESVTIPANCLLVFDGGSISDGVITCNNTILVFDQDEEVILKNVELLGDYDYSAGGSGGVNKKDNVNGMATITLKKNKSFASQITQTNTIYRIMYDFDLGGETITIPENCVLEFDGGSISNGRCIGNNTSVKGLFKAGENFYYYGFINEYGLYVHNVIYSELVSNGTVGPNGDIVITSSNARYTKFLYSLKGIDHITSVFLNSAQYSLRFAFYDKNGYYVGLSDYTPLDYIYIPTEAIDGYCRLVFIKSTPDDLDSLFYTSNILSENYITQREVKPIRTDGYIEDFEININSLTKYQGFVNKSGHYSKIEGKTSLVIPVCQNGVRYDTIYFESGEHNTQFAFVTSYNFNKSSTVSFCSTRPWLLTNRFLSTGHYDIPSTCAFVIVNADVVLSGNPEEDWFTPDKIVLKNLRSPTNKKIYDDAKAKELTYRQDFNDGGNTVKTKVLFWNVGHWNPDGMPNPYYNNATEINDALNSVRTFINELNPGVVSICEDSEIVKAKNNQAVNSTDALFNSRFHSKYVALNRSFEQSCIFARHKLVLPPDGVCERMVSNQNDGDGVIVGNRSFNLHAVISYLQLNNAYVPVINVHIRSNQIDALYEQYGSMSIGIILGDFNRTDPNDEKFSRWTDNGWHILGAPYDDYDITIDSSDSIVIDGTTYYYKDIALQKHYHLYLNNDALVILDGSTVLEDRDIYDNSGDITVRIASQTQATYTNGYSVMTPTFWKNKTVRYDWVLYKSVIVSNFVSHTDIELSDHFPCSFDLEAYSLPSNPRYGYEGFDTGINKPTWFDGTQWITPLFPDFNELASDRWVDIASTEQNPVNFIDLPAGKYKWDNGNKVQYVTDWPEAINKSAGILLVYPMTNTANGRMVQILFTSMRNVFAFRPSRSSDQSQAYWSIFKGTATGSEAPQSSDSSIGMTFFNTTVNKPSWKASSKYVDAFGANANVNYSGTWANRPTTIGDIYEGFKYMLNDGTSHFPIYAHINGSTIEWYKADGTQYTGS